MMIVGLHAHLPGRPGRIGCLHWFLNYIPGFDRVRVARRDDIARYWDERYPNV